MTLAAADAHYQRQQQLSRQATAAAGRLWTSRLDPDRLDASYNGDILSDLLRLITGYQVAAAATADSYVDQVLLEQDITTDVAGAVAPKAFATIASDGRNLTSLLREPLIRVKTALLTSPGIGTGAASNQGLSSLLRIVNTQVSDAGRTATGVALTARPAVDGYIRMLSPPSCPRCAVLAGRFYRWSSGFQRHPHCDCQHVPTQENRGDDLRTDPDMAFAAGEIHGLSAADTRAIEDGADLGKVINAHRGMSTADVYGRRAKVTTEGTKGRKTARVPRLRPESIYQLADGDRTEAIRLLTRFGYITS